MLRDVWDRRRLVAALVGRQFQLRYRQSMVGFVWSFLPTVTTLAAATLVFHKFAKIDTGGIPYPLFAMAALVPWSFLSSSIGGGVSSIAGSGMVAKLTFPRAVLPLTTMGLACIDMAMSFVIFVVFLAIGGRFLPISAVWFLPLFAIELVLVFGVVLLGAAMNTFARDISLAMGPIMQLWLFLTPVLYPLRSVPARLQGLYLLNPMSGLIIAFRQVLAQGRAPDPTVLLPAVIGAAVLLVTGGWYFATMERRFADVI